MSIDIWLTFGILVLILGLLFAEVFSADLIFLGGLGLLVATGVLPLERALDGFANATLVALGSLYVVAAALRRTGILEVATRHILGGSKNLRAALARMTIPVSIGSAFINNTPIVAMGIPALRTWAKDNEISASMLLMPLSFASIVGGMCTLMGTSTNLVAHGLLKASDREGLGFFELAGIGIPCAIVGWLYLVFVAPLLLKRTEGSLEEKSRLKSELVQIDLVEDSELDGSTLEETGLQSLPGLSLIRIERGDESIDEPDEDQALQVGDSLFYAPDVRASGGPLDLGDQPGLKLAVSDVEQIPISQAASDQEHHSIVVRLGSQLVGKRVDETRFAKQFHAEVREVRRGGKSIDDGDPSRVRLRPGDTLLVTSRGGFREAFEDSPEFFVTSSYDHMEEAAASQSTMQKIQLGVVLTVLVAIVALTVSDVFPIAISALLGAVAVLMTGIMSTSEARNAIDWEVLLVIGAALGLGEAIQVSGAADLLGSAIIQAGSGFGDLALLAAVVLCTAILTELITNNGAVALVFPIAVSIASARDIDVRPLVIGITAAGSMSMLTPFGYQTNLMVYSAGDYRFVDFVRVGLPLQVALIGLTLVVVPFIWPF